MASKGAKETIASKLGFKSSSSASKAEVELERVRKENAHLRKKIDELAKRHIKPPDSDKSKLLEVKEVFPFVFFVFFNVMFLLLSFSPFVFQRILSLETLRERNNQQLLVKEQELAALRQQLSARGGEVCTPTSLQRCTVKSHLYRELSIIKSAVNTDARFWMCHGITMLLGGAPTAVSLRALFNL